MSWLKARRLLGGVVCAFAMLVLPVAAASATEVEPTCVADSKSVTSHTYDGDRTAVITVTGALPLCTPLTVNAIRWEYKTPPAQWSQNNPTSSGVVVIQNPGTYTITAPEREPGKCHQWDFYAEAGKNPVYPDQLNGSNNPFEPKFLMNFSNGPVTYSHDSVETCNDQVPPVGPNPTDFNINVTTPTCTIASIDVTGEYANDAEATASLQQKREGVWATVDGDENVNDGIQLTFTPAPGESADYRVIATFKDDGTGVTILKTFPASRPTIESCIVVPPPVEPPVVVPPVVTPPVVTPPVVTPPAVTPPVVTTPVKTPVVVKATSKVTPKVTASTTRVLAETGPSDQLWSIVGWGAFLVVAGSIAFAASKRRRSQA